MGLMWSMNNLDPTRRWSHHSESNPHSSKGESRRLRLRLRSLAWSPQERAVDMLKWHLYYTLADAAPPTGAPLSRAKVCRVRRDVNRPTTQLRLWSHVNRE